MAALCRTFARSSLTLHSGCLFVPLRLSNTLPNAVVEKSRRSRISHTRVVEDGRKNKADVANAPRDYKFVFPEFLPNPDVMKRDRLSEKLERREMMRRRAVLDVPEFYVGSVLAVTVSDLHAPGKKNCFVGICVQRIGHGLRANFTLRNVVDGEGTEIRYDLYSPMLLKIEVLKLEKRVDDELFYLRDAPVEHSTFPFDMEPVTLPPGASVPINTIKVKLNPLPWDSRWEIRKLKGVEGFELPPVKVRRANHPQVTKTWEKHDLMKQYRESINEEETKEIMTEVYSSVKELESEKLKKKQVSRSFVPSKTDKRK